MGAFIFASASVFISQLKTSSLTAFELLAWQIFFPSVEGSSSFKNYPKIGGETIMRGYYSGRYRDKYLLAFQGEYRLPWWWR
ncbi:MAG: hypothetical protein N3B16_04105 [Candidatus Aminicenantes bacterium]|nr:hypothetical protein [Candidatus Aminicenantes bacterium]